MHDAFGHLVHFLKKDNGPTAVEYAVLLALVIVVCVAAVAAIGTDTNSTYCQVAARIR